MYRSIVVYIIALLLMDIVFVDNSMPWYWQLLNMVEVGAFFYFSYLLTYRWQGVREKYVERMLFGLVVISRLSWILIFYGLTNVLWDTPWEQPIGVDIDSAGYFNTAKWIEECIKTNKLDHYIAYVKMMGWSDVGYPVILSLLNFISDDSILFTRIPNAFFDAWTTLLVYKLAKRNFGEEVAKMAALFTFLMPTMFYFAATTMKESVMVMFCIWFLERADYVMRQPKFLLKNVFEIMLLVLAIAFFRTVLAWVAILAFACSLILVSNRTLNLSRKITIALVGSIIGILLFGGVFLQQVEEVEMRQKMVKNNLEVRATREGGNKLVKNLNRAIFFPLVFTIPFPTMVDISYQQAQQIQSGGFYMKNIMAFFCVLALILLTISKEWKNSVLIIAFYLGYLMVLALSSYTQSGRFHQPIIPLLMIFASYGITHFKTSWKRYFNYFLVFEFIVIITWNLFKLRGRGLM